jgi:alanine dehydrogenase
MLIGVPKEIKDHEYRVGMVPASVDELIQQGHQVLVETNAGMGIGFSDDHYLGVGAMIAQSAEDVFAKADMLVKVKEPLAQERVRLKPEQILFTFLHLAADRSQTQDLIKSQATCIAYETVTSESGLLPLLAPMSEVAGRMSVQAGAQCLEKSNGGNGLLLAGIPGVSPAKVVVIGGGVVGSNAAKIAMGMGARVTVVDRSLEVLRRLDHQFNACQLGASLETVYASKEALEQQVLAADLVIGAVLVPGAAAPRLVSKQMIQQMKPGAAVVDVAIDQGGCFETSHATTHSAPSFIVDGVVHYCVANMPGAVPKTSTFALNNATLPYIVNLANKGYKAALLEDDNLINGLNIYRGQVTCHSVAQSLGFDYVEARKALTEGRK